jgi:hypothetical protein
MYKMFSFIGIIIGLSSVVNAGPTITLRFDGGSMRVAPKGDRISVSSLKERFSAEHATPKKHRLVVTDGDHSPLPDAQVIKGNQTLTLLVKFVKEDR